MRGNRFTAGFSKTIRRSVSSNTIIHVKILRADTAMSACVPFRQQRTKSQRLILPCHKTRNTRSLRAARPRRTYLAQAVSAANVARGGGSTGLALVGSSVGPSSVLLSIVPPFLWATALGSASVAAETESTAISALIWSYSPSVRRHSPALSQELVALLLTMMAGGGRRGRGKCCSRTLIGLAVL